MEITGCAVCGAGIDQISYVLQMIIPGSEVAPKAGFCSDVCLAQKLGFAKVDPSESVDPNGLGDGALAGIE
jgi:hypothetical protein